MLQLFAFSKVGVAVADLYFVDPNPAPGQEGAERGVRLEVRLVERREHDGSVYASRPILVGRPIWRADLLETVAGPAGSFDRTHHHPRMRGWEPGSRQFDPAPSADPLGWVGARLSDLDGLLAAAGVDPGDVDPTDADDLRRAAPDIVAATRRLLDAVHAGELAREPAGAVGNSVRQSWL
ncbi:MAG TPA: hypothetical protein VFP54_10870 [Acidimicrobiales bacterium]|nr:hypothetical protein [Acidimicrobiales bacterium]